MKTCSICHIFNDILFLVQPHAHMTLDPSHVTVFQWYQLFLVWVCVCVCVSVCVIVCVCVFVCVWVCVGVCVCVCVGVHVWISPLLCVLQSLALHKAGTWYYNLDSSHLSLSFNSVNGSVYCSQLFTCKVHIQVRWSLLKIEYYTVGVSLYIKMITENNCILIRPVQDGRK